MHSYSDFVPGADLDLDLDPDIRPDLGSNTDHDIDSDLGPAGRWSRLGWRAWGITATERRSRRRPTPDTSSPSTNTCRRRRRRGCVWSNPYPRQLRADIRVKSESHLSQHRVDVGPGSGSESITRASCAVIRLGISKTAPGSCPPRRLLSGGGGGDLALLALEDAQERQQQARLACRTHARTHTHTHGRTHTHAPRHSERLGRVFV